MSPPDVSHLVAHWTVRQPYLPTHAPQARWTTADGTQHTAPARLIGTVRETSPILESQANFHYAAILQVPRGATVTYEVGEPTLGWSAPHNATMPPFEATPVRLAVMGFLGHDGFDDGTGARIPSLDAPTERVVARALEGQPDVVLLAGNIAVSTELGAWDATLSMLEPLVAQVPLMAVPGATENSDNFENLRERFVWPLLEPVVVSQSSTLETVDQDMQALQNEHMYHGFSAGPVYVFGLNGLLCEDLVPVVTVNVALPPCDVGDGQFNPEQLSWLHDALEDAREDYGPRWIVAYLGLGPYVHADDAGNAMVDTYLRPILEDFGVDVVLYGSEAIYQRSFPLWEAQPMTRAATHYKHGTGTIYVNTGGGGSPVTEPLPGRPAWLAASASTHHVTFLDAGNDTLTLTAVEADTGRILDTFTLHQSTSPGYEQAAGFGPSHDPVGQEAPAPAFLVLAALALAFAARRRWT